MTELYRGAELAKRMCAELKKTSDELQKSGIFPKLAILRVGEHGSDTAYEAGARKRCMKAGVEVETVVFPAEVGEREVLEKLEDLNEDPLVHGILILRPLPEQLDEETIRRALSPAKDVDGFTYDSLAGVFAGSDTAFLPCTAEACMEVLNYHQIEVKGKHVTIVGSSLVVGRPAAMMLLKRFATVTLCHIFTENVPLECKAADIIIAAAGSPELIGREHVKEGQILLDVGINLKEDGSICGDVDAEAVTGIVKALTPVPGGIGTVTTAVLAKHVIEAATNLSAV